MLDIHFIRDNKDLIQEAAKKKRIDFDVAQLIEIDDKRKAVQQEVDDLRAKQNTASDAIALLTDPEEKQQKIAESKEAKEALQKKEEELKQVMEEWKALMIRVPNIPDMSVPDGEDESDNQELKQVGDKPKFSFEPKDHVELMTALEMADFERGTKIHGFRGYVLIGDGALLSHSIWDCARDFFLKKNFTYALPPAIAKKEYFYGTGHLPSDAEDLYVTQDDDYLSGTSEVPMMAYHSDEVLAKDQLPKRYLAFSPCYRREAGSHGKDTKGLLRVHEFYKLEQLVLCEADHQKSVEYHEELNRNTEEFIELLGLPYRQVTISTGDLKAGHVKSYDTELWIPSQKTYREIASASYYHDFQSRRFNIRYDDGGKKQYVHSLNATAIPTPRVLIAIVENNQNEDGSITIPEALRPYLGGREVFSSRA
ncbi:MAG: serine--tRNA ligase [Candidatus Paceibacterota bacterium]